jgi:hypothetical protein
MLSHGMGFIEKGSSIEADHVTGSNFILARKESLRLHPSLPIQHPNFKTPGISEHSRFHTELEVPEEGPLGAFPSPLSGLSRSLQALPARLPTLNNPVLPVNFLF